MNDPGRFALSRWRPGDRGAVATARAAAAGLERSPFSSLDWFLLLANHGLPATREALFLQVAAAGSDSPPQLLLPLQAPARGGPLRLRRQASLASFYSPVFELPAREGGVEPAAYRALAAGLRRQVPAVDVLDLEPLAEEDPHADRLAQALRDEGFFVTSYARFGNWVLFTEGRTFDDYLAGRPGALRNTLRRKRRALERAGAARFAVFRHPEEVARAVADYQAVYARSWKRPEPYPDFVPGLMDLAARRGWLRCGVLYLDDRPAAVQLWLIAGAAAYIFKLAYDPDFAQYSPGTLLSAHMFREAIDGDSVGFIDYLIGDDEYKRLWMERRRTRYGVLAANPGTLGGRWVIARERLGALVRPVRAAPRGSPS